MSTYTLPKPYLSFSQMSLWERSPSQYCQRYFAGEALYETPQMQLGKAFARARETEDFTGKPAAWERAHRQLPPLPLREVQVEATMRGVPMMGYIDGASVDMTTISDDKTGKVNRQRWEDQIVFYAVMIDASEDEDLVSIKQAQIHYFPTDNGQITGEATAYTVEITESKKAAMRARVVRVAEEIAAAYADWKERNEAAIDQGQLALYASVTLQIAMLKEQQATLKEAIQQDMQQHKVQTLRTEVGQFSLRRGRKRWQYPEEINEIEKSLREQKKAYERRTEPESVEGPTVSFRAR